MKGFFARHPMAPVVISILALVLAAVGTGYAAFKLPKNSVGSKQLKKNAVTTGKIKKSAVTGAKVKKHTLTGSNINLNKLGTVPSAQTANSLSPTEPIRLVGTSGQPGFESGSSNAPPIIPGASFTQVGFYKDHEGIVHLTGAAKVGVGAKIFTLPEGFRPPSGTVMIFEPVKEAPVIIGGSNTQLETLNASGAVIGGKEFVSLEGITFRPGS